MAPRIKSMNQIFVIINHPVERKLPYVIGSYLPNPYITELYNRQSEAEPFLSKRELEKLWIMPMTGPRYSILKVNAPDVICPMLTEETGHHPLPQQPQPGHPSLQ